MQKKWGNLVKIMLFYTCYVAEIKIWNSKIWFKTVYRFCTIDLAYWEGRQGLTIHTSVSGLLVCLYPKWTIWLQYIWPNWHQKGTNIPCTVSRQPVSGVRYVQNLLLDFLSWTRQAHDDLFFCSSKRKVVWIILKPLTLVGKKLKTIIWIKCAKPHVMNSSCLFLCKAYSQWCSLFSYLYLFDH